MKLTLIKTMIFVTSMLMATARNASDIRKPTAKQLVGTRFIEVAGAAEADLYYQPCTIKHCPSPDLQNLGTPATVAQVKGFKIATPLENAN